MRELPRRYLILLWLIGSISMGTGLAMSQVMTEELKKLYRIDVKEFRKPAGAIPLESVRIYPPGGDDPGGVFIGAAQDFAEDEQDRVFIPDRQASEILVFDAKGGFQFRFGRWGQGPGEFNRPTGICAWGDKVLTHEVMALRFQIFDAKGRFLSSFISSKSYGDFLVLGDKIYANSSQSGPPEFGSSLIDVLDFKGKVLSSFGAVPKVPRYNSEGLASANIAPADGGILFVAFRYFSIIRAYSLEGKLIDEFKWQSGVTERIAPLNEKMFARRERGEQTPLGIIAPAIYADQDGLYVLASANSRLEILLFDPKGKIKEYFYKDLASPLGPTGLLVRKQAGQKEFHILRRLPEHGVEVFAAK